MGDGRERHEGDGSRQCQRQTAILFWECLSPSRSGERSCALQPAAKSQVQASSFEKMDGWRLICRFWRVTSPGRGSWKRFRTATGRHFLVRHEGWRVGGDDHRGSECGGLAPAFTQETFESIAAIYGGDNADEIWVVVNRTIEESRSIISSAWIQASARLLNRRKRKLIGI